jgi:hypothetical protein
MLVRITQERQELDAEQKEKARVNEVLKESCESGVKYTGMALDWNSRLPLSHR